MAKSPSQETVKVSGIEESKVREVATKLGVVMKNFPIGVLPSIALIEYTASKGMDLTYTEKLGGQKAVMIPKSGNGTGSNGSTFNGPWKVTDLTEDLQTVLAWACAQSKSGTATKAVTSVVNDGNKLVFKLRNGQSFTLIASDDGLTVKQNEQVVKQATSQAIALKPSDKSTGK